MKCIKYIGAGTHIPAIERVSEVYAKTMVDGGRWAYCPKHEWKAQQKKEG